ncbi:MAG: Na+/H+ antiporter NhaA [Ponticaulis sp.]|nr:Na+/H+ antiporter NhaA [Ponticaulis sp.]|tara:strand:- start:180 stop:1391 length:1212 start_codon:yes stop_codon:yes gene_type:complete
MNELPQQQAPSQQTQFERVLRSPAIAGGVLLLAMLVAFVWVNSPFADTYEAIHHAPASVSIGSFELAKPLILWINEGLMVVFFFLIGLEIKREAFEGQLSSPKQIALPALAALGGMVVPATIFLGFNSGSEQFARGWAVPVATDIVLALALLAMLGSRVPIALKVFLTALAIFDDFGTLVIIALAYSEGLSLPSLLMAGLGTLVLIALNRLRVASLTAYILIGVLVWVSVLESGVHSTLAGVIIAWTIPMRVAGREFLHKVEHDLSPWVALLIVPVFAFFNAGIDLRGVEYETFFGPLGLGIILGLFIGKQVGVMLGVGIALFLKIGKKPAGVGWRELYGAALLSGVGFTMSLFVAGLAFEQPGAVLTVNLAIVVGSVFSAVGGLAVLARPRRSSRSGHGNCT